LKTVHTALEEANGLKFLLETIQSLGEFNRIGFSNKWSVLHAHKLKVALMKPEIKRVLSDDIHRVIFLEALFTTLPLTDDVGRKWIFNQRANMSIVENVLQPVGSSIAIRKRKAPTAPSLGKPDSTKKKNNGQHGHIQCGKSHVGCCG